jgi:hypothetical protein
MVLSLSILSLVAIVVTFADAAAAVNDTFNLRPFKIDLSSQIPHLNDLVRSTRFPSKALYPNAGTEKGIELDTLLELRNEWLDSFDWETQEAELNQSAFLISHLY